MVIRDISEKDYQAVLDIYNYYVLNTTYTLEYDALTLKDFSARIESIRSSYPYLVCEDGNGISGYAYLDPFGVRKGYMYTCDVAIYVARDKTGQGIGRLLMSELCSRAKAQGIRDIIAAITDENLPSLAFHESQGFVRAGVFPGVADKFSRRFGVVYMQKTIQ